MITLNAGAILVYQIGGAAVETDDHAALVGLAADWLRNTLTLTFAYGSAPGGGFTPGFRPALLTASVDLGGGGWTSSTGASGVLTPAQLAGVVSSLRADRNTGENFAAGAAGGFLPGTTTPW